MPNLLIVPPLIINLNTFAPMLIRQFLHEETEEERGRTTGLLIAFGCKHKHFNGKHSHRQRHRAQTPARVDHTFER